MENNKSDDILRELRAIKKLLAVQLYVSGVLPEDISKIIGLDAGTIRNFVKKGKTKK